MAQMEMHDSIGPTDWARIVRAMFTLLTLIIMRFEGLRRQELIGGGPRLPALPGHLDLLMAPTAPQNSSSHTAPSWTRTEMSSSRMAATARSARSRQSGPTGSSQP